MNASLATEKDEEVRKVAIKDRTNRIAKHFDGVPPRGSTCVRVFMEIVSAHSFGRDTLFVEYVVVEREAREF